MVDPAWEARANAGWAAVVAGAAAVFAWATWSTPSLPIVGFLTAAWLTFVALVVVGYVVLTVVAWSLPRAARCGFALRYDADADFVASELALILPEGRRDAAAFLAELQRGIRSAADPAEEDPADAE